MTTTTRAQISISQDGVWAGEGTLRDGIIEDCAACLGPSKGQDKGDDVEAAYLAIEAAIAATQDSVTVDGVEYTWGITLHPSEES